MDANIFNIEILGNQAGWPIIWMLSKGKIGDRCRLPHSIVSHNTAVTLKEWMLDGCVAIEATTVMEKQLEKYSY